MKSEKVIQQIEAGRIIAILRGDFGGREEDMAAVLLEAGLTAVEVTLNSSGALDSIRRLAARFGAHMAVGAGTVLSSEEVEKAAVAGAQFIVSPNRSLPVITATKRLGLASFPGCFTPSEIVEALAAGADAAKIFPAQSLGPDFIKAVRGPLPQARLIPTGGVTPEAMGIYLAAGAWAVGVGSELIGREIQASDGLERLRQRALAYAAGVQVKGKSG
jgi:2-dehydro-3-deoxyphosphogluconate aldolase/(4S)-4-hydroxy-2-oxoglutarate aldolase